MRTVTGFVIPIIRTALIGIEHVNVFSKEDKADMTQLGNLVNAQSLKQLNKEWVMDNIISSTITGKLDDKQPFLWSLDRTRSSITSVFQNINESSSFNKLPMTQFIATLPVGTDTGVLRELGLRLNLSVSCDLVPQTDFPSQCLGTDPLDRTLTNINVTTSNPFGDLDHTRYRARICAPGNVFRPHGITLLTDKIYPRNSG